MTGARVELFQYDLPLTMPFVVHGVELARRQGLILRLNEANTALGEIAPLPGVSIETLDQARDAAIEWCRTVSASTITPAGIQALPRIPSVRCGVGCAVDGLLGGDAHSLPVRAGRVLLNGLISGRRDQAVEQADRLRREHYAAAKLKVGRSSVEDDVATVAEVRKALGEGVSLRLDANRAWAYEDALAFACAVRECGIEYVEEPLREPARLGEFARESGIPVALDESVVENIEDAGFLAEQPWAQAVVLKPTLIGDWATLDRLAAEAASYGMKAVVSSCFESGVGIAALSRWAATTLNPAVPMGLDTYPWLAEDVLRERFRVRNGALDLEETSRSLATLDTTTMECVFHG